MYISVESPFRISASGLRPRQVLLVWTALVFLASLYFFFFLVVCLLLLWLFVWQCSRFGEPRLHMQSVVCAVSYWFKLSLLVVVVADCRLL